MLEEIKRKEVDKRDKQLPQNFEQLIQMYDLDKIWASIDNIINYSNNDIPEIINGTVLYYNASGINGNITLNDNISNYSEIQVDYKITIGDYTISERKRVPISSGQSISLDFIISHSDVVQLFRSTRYLVSGTSMTKIHEVGSRISSSGAQWDGELTSCKVTKVVGFK